MIGTKRKPSVSGFRFERTNAGAYAPCSLLHGKEADAVRTHFWRSIWKHIPFVFTDEKPENCK